MMEIWTQADTWLALVTLSAMEIVLGIDNVVFISIVVARLEGKERERIRKLGITLALGIRILLLFSISWMMSLTSPLFSLFGFDFSGRNLILLGGGLFLIAKATHEIHGKLESGPADRPEIAKHNRSPFWLLIEILLLDIVFSLDSVITAVGMASHVPVMIAAMCIAMLVMLFSSSYVGAFVEEHPTIKILALSFLLLIGVLLLAEGFGAHISKGYVYFAMAFSLGVELLNMRFRAKHGAPVVLKSPEDQEGVSSRS